MPRRRRPSLEWISGEFDTLGAGTAGTGGTARSLALLSLADIANLGSSDFVIVRRIVGCVCLANTTAATAGAFAYGIYRTVYSSGTTVQDFSLTNENDYEDVRWLVRRDWSSCGHTSTDVGPMMAGGPWWVDWKGACKLEEGKSELRVSALGTANFQSFIRLRVLVQTGHR